MRRRSRALHGALVTVLGLALTACGGAGGGEEREGSKGRATKDDSVAESPSVSAAPSPSVEWSPALSMGQPAAELFEPANSGGGRFQVAVEKMVKGTPEQMKEGYYDGKGLGDTPYFVYVACTLKEGKPAYANSDLNANAVALDEGGEEVAKRPIVHTDYVDGGCPEASGMPGPSRGGSQGDA